MSSGMSLRRGASRRGSSASSEYSCGSHYSKSTAPSDISVKPSLRHIYADVSEAKEQRRWEDSCCGETASQLSLESCASTVASDAGLDEDDLVYDQPSQLRQEPSTSSAYASTPSEFANFFPSTRRLCIRHDDTIDGNMNIRVDTETQTQSGRKVDLTLFHLRLHDLKRREFSFRRYCRESGREICHTGRKYTKPKSKGRPAFQRSMSSALASLMSVGGDRSAIKGMKRENSGFQSIKSNKSVEVEDEESKPASSTKFPMPTNTTLLEFSNYAHVELKRRGATSSKRYEFEYWGKKYTWRRSEKKCGLLKEFSYHLFASQSALPVAHIVPSPMSPFEAEEEERKGGWIPPSSMWISDPRVLNALTDVADVIVATGLLAFVDDCIKNRWHRKDRFQLHIPLLSLGKKAETDYVGPKQLIDGVFGRSTGQNPRCGFC